MKNELKRLLKEGGFAIGAGVTIGHPEVAEVIGQFDFDWVFLDMEHTPMGLETLQELMQVLSISHRVPIVRVPWNDPVMIKRVLDIGAYGVVVPMVNTRDEAERAVRAIRYPPLGLRGFGPRRAAATDPEYANTANTEIFLGVQIESGSAVENIDDILSVEGIDAALVGPYDLSLNLGLFGKWDDSRFVGAINKIIDSARRNGVTPGNLAPRDIAEALSQGFRMLLIEDDIDLLRNALRSSLERSRSLVGNVRR